MIKLYYYPNNASLAPHFLLHHFKAHFELVLVDTESNVHKSDEYLSLNPAGRIPTLQIDGQTIFESPAICIHLCELNPEFGLMPLLGDPKRPLFFQWLSFLNNTLQAEIMVRYYAHRHTTDQAAIGSIVAAQDDRIADALQVIEQQLANHRYLLGDDLSACDYFLFMLCEWALPAKRSPLSYPHLAAYLKGLCSNATIQDVCAFEGIDLTPFNSYAP